MSTSVRVVSLVPSVTETLLSWGVVPVGVTRFCERPDLPAVGGTKNPDLAAITALAPDVVVMCTEENRLEDATALERSGIAVHAMEIDSVDDVAPALVGLAEAIGERPRTIGALPLPKAIERRVRSSRSGVAPG